MTQDEERRGDNSQRQGHAFRQRHYPGQYAVVYGVPGTSKHVANCLPDMSNRHINLARQGKMSYIREVSRHAEQYDLVASPKDGVPRCPGAKAINRTVS